MLRFYSEKKKKEENHPKSKLSKYHIMPDKHDPLTG